MSAMALRKPTVSGKFYSKYKEELNTQILNCFYSEQCLGKSKKIEEIRVKDGLVKAGIVPHAGYDFSGPCAANFYKEMLEHELPQIIFIIGSNHAGFSSAIATDDFETPIGIVKTDSELAARLSTELGIEISELSHRTEHSIEIQLPFLQFIYQFRGENFRIVPILISEDINFVEIGSRLRKMRSELDEAGIKSMIIVSTDMTHYGMKFGYKPYTGNLKSVLEKIKNHDLKVINIIKQFESKKLLNFVNKSETTICGVYPILVLMEALEEVKEAKLLKYCNSYDINRKQDEIVAYAAMVFE